MSYQLNPSATSNMPGDIVQVKIPNDDDYIVCVGSDGVPFVSSKNAISGSSSPQTLFDELVNDRNCGLLFYPNYHSVTRFPNSRFLMQPQTTGTLDSVIYTSTIDGVFVPFENILSNSNTSSETLTSNHFVFSSIASVMDFSASLIFYVEDIGNVSAICGGLYGYGVTVFPSISIASGNISGSATYSFGGLKTLISSLSLAGVSNGWNIATFNSSGPLGYASESNPLTINMLVNGVEVVSETYDGSSGSASGALTNSGFQKIALKSGTAGAYSAASFLLSKTLSTSEQLTYFNKFKSDHGIA